MRSKINYEILAIICYIRVKIRTTVAFFIYVAIVSTVSQLIIPVYMSTS